MALDTRFSPAQVREVSESNDPVSECCTSISVWRLHLFVSGLTNVAEAFTYETLSQLPSIYRALNEADDMVGS